MKIILLLLKKSELLSSISVKLVKLTGKSKNPIHPKHLLKKNNVWFKKYLKKTIWFLILDVELVQTLLNPLN